MLCYGLPAYLEVIWFFFISCSFYESHYHMINGIYKNCSVKCIKDFIPLKINWKKQPKRVVLHSGYGPIAHPYIILIINEWVPFERVYHSHSDHRAVNVGSFDKEALIYFCLFVSVFIFIFVHSSSFSALIYIVISSRIYFSLTRQAN